MNNENRKMIDVMEAYLDGATIEARRTMPSPGKPVGATWGKVSFPGWNWAEFDYRVAPIKVTKFCVLYGTLEHGVEFLVGNFATHDEAVSYAEEHEHSSMPWMVKPIEQA